MNIITTNRTRELRTGFFGDGCMWCFEPGELVIFNNKGDPILCITMLAQIWPPR